MPAKIITLSQKDQDLLREAFTWALIGVSKDSAVNSEWGVTLFARIKDLKERLL